MTEATGVEGRIHFIGVGGAGMSAVAWLMHAAGVKVSGSDAADGPYLRALAARGLDVSVGHDAARVAGATAVVVSSAVKPDNTELSAAREARVRVWHRSEALAVAAAGKRILAVAGSHGKTTTSAMAAHMLHQSGIDASFAIGAPVYGVDGAVAGGYAGEADIIVIEADESDGSFLNYTPDVAIVTNIEADHLDYYGSVEAVEAAFVEFASEALMVVACADDAGSALLAETLIRDFDVHVTTYGFGTKADAAPDVVLDEGGVRDEAGAEPLEVFVPGDHNRANAAAAWAAVVDLGADRSRAARAVASFRGTGRRYERRGEVGGVAVIDDYAHHPTEIRALLDAARREFDGRIVVLFQPHLYSRTRLLAADFAEALADPNADVIVAGIYGAREEPEPGVGPETITALVSVGDGSTVRAIEDLRDAAAAAAAAATPGSAVFTVGAGSVTDAADWVLDDLRARFDA